MTQLKSSILQHCYFQVNAFRGSVVRYRYDALPRERRALGIYLDAQVKREE